MKAANPILPNTKTTNMNTEQGDHLCGALTELVKPGARLMWGQRASACNLLLEGQRCRRRYESLATFIEVEA